MAIHLNEFKFPFNKYVLTATIRRSVKLRCCTFQRSFYMYMYHQTDAFSSQRFEVKRKKKASG